MFGSTMLEVALGMAFMYTLLSLVCSTAREAIESWTKSRSADLERGIRQLLSGGQRTGGPWRWITETVNGHSLEMSADNGHDDTKGVVKAFYEHPLIQSLYSGSAGPSYIPTRNFVAALLDLAKPAATSLEKLAPSGAPAMTLNDVIAAMTANTTLPEGLRKAVAALAQQAEGDLERFKALLGDWFDGTMDRVAGWYKRRTQAMLFVIGFAVAITTNADSLEMVTTLARDQGVRASLAGAAAAYSALPEEQRKADSELKRAVSAAVTQIQQTGVPIGWHECDSAKWADRTLSADCFPGSPAGLFNGQQSTRNWLALWWFQLRTHLFGWLLTTLALTLGAPFWFDVLNRIMVIRSTVKPHEKSAEEGSEDRQAPASPTVTLKIEGARAAP